MSITRNNTDFAVRLTEMLKNMTIKSEYDFLKYYQNIVRLFYTNLRVDSRGLLIYFTMGIGKSIAAIAVAMEMMDKYQPILVLSKSLQENMKGAIKKYMKLRGVLDPSYPLGKLSEGDMDNYIKKKFSFVSMNASNMLDQLYSASETVAEREMFKALDGKLEKLRQLENLNGKFIIVDEAHNLFRAIGNGSKNAKGFYDLVMASSNVKLMFLTGTPINDPFDCVACFNMLNGFVPQQGRAGGVSIPLFPENYADFFDYFVDPQTHCLINKTVFQNRIFGLVSHISHTSKITAGAIEFPEKLPTVVEYVPMADSQYSYYQLARQKESEEGRGKKFAMNPVRMQKPKSSFVSSYRVRSRQISNFVAPPSHIGERDVRKIPDEFITSPKFVRLAHNLKNNLTRIGYIYSQFVGIGGLASVQRFLELHGYTELIVDAGALKQSKIALGKTSASASASADSVVDAESEIVDIVPMDEDDEDVVLNDFLKTAGTIKPEKKDGGADVRVDVGVKTRDMFGKGLKFAVIKGGVDTLVRDKFRDIYSDYDNRYGERLHLLLISSTGAEGLDLKNTGHEHVLEPYWNYGRIEQIEHRGIRNDSHTQMKENEKKVQVYHYLSIPPKAEQSKVMRDIVSFKVALTDVDTKKEFIPEDSILAEKKLLPPAEGGKFMENLTTDMELYINALIGDIGNRTFTDAYKEVSIECYLNGEENCRVCNPDNSKLFNIDISVDINRPDPCRPYNLKKVVAKEVVYDGVVYYYMVNDKSLFGYNVFRNDTKIGAYVRVGEDTVVFKKIVEAIGAL